MDTIILQGTTTEAFAKLITEGVKDQIDALEKKISSKDQDELLTREQTCDLLKIDPSTLWAWQKKGKITAYGISGNRVYYKKSELLESLKPINK